MTNELITLSRNLKRRGFSQRDRQIARKIWNEPVSTAGCVLVKRGTSLSDMVCSMIRMYGIENLKSNMVKVLVKR